VSLRQLYSPLRLYANSLHPALNGPAHWFQRPNISVIVPLREAGFKGMAGEGDVQQLFWTATICVREFYQYFLSVVSENLKEKYI